MLVSFKPTIPFPVGKFSLKHEEHNRNLDGLVPSKQKSVPMRLLFSESKWIVFLGNVDYWPVFLA